MARDFSSVTSRPDRPARRGAPAPAGGTADPDTASSPSRKWLLIAAAAAVALLVIAVLIKALTGGDADAASGETAGAPSGGVRAAHGPVDVVDGVPIGYTRDEMGARTAAVNFTQSVGHSYEARITGTAVRDHAVSASATTALTEVVDNASNRSDDSRVTSAVPLTTTAVNYTDDEAVVSIWANSLGQIPYGDAGEVGIISVYGTTTVTMVWEDGDWKAADWSFENGPDPADARFPAADSPLAAQSAGSLYSVYVG